MRVWITAIKVHKVKLPQVVFNAAYISRKYLLNHFCFELIFQYVPILLPVPDILEDNHSLTDIVSAVATVVGQGEMNPAALHAFANRGRRRRPLGTCKIILITSKAIVICSSDKGSEHCN